MSDAQSLEERLRSHANAFNGLLSLIPAKVYYGEDTSDQWQRKKQTKEEARAARIAKLDPANQKSALDVIQEKERKRKREETGQADENDRTEEARQEPKRLNPPKKQRIENKPMVSLPPADDEAIRLAKRDKRKQKRDEKRARKEEQQAKKQLKKQQKEQARAQAEGSDGDSDDDAVVGMDPLDVSGLGDEEEHEADVWESASEDDDHSEQEDIQSSTAESSAKDDSPAFDFSAQPSGTSSVSSTENTDPPILSKAKSQKPSSLDRANAVQPAAPKQESSLTKEETAERIRNKLAALRAARKADVDGQPARTRAELLDSRRKKTDLRKERKKALRQQAKEEEERKREEAIARGSPLMSPSIRSPPPEEANNFSFGKVAFENGQSMTADLNTVLDMSKKRGPSDLRTAMLASDAKNARLSALDPKQRAEIAEKDMWLTARKRAHGEKAKDDQSLLKKALKRKEKQKEKSTTDWRKRIDGVKAGKEARQKKREENLAKRKESKGQKSSKGTKGGKTKKPKKRPGFEGSFRAGGKK